jgi:hypothetical protein
MKHLFIHKKAYSHTSEGSVCKEARYWEDAHYHEYIKHHGEHFSRSLSIWACSMMENRNGKTHSWTPEQVDAALTSMGYHLEAKHKYDAHYLANMFYADNMGKPAKDESECLELTIAFLTDPDGYCERAFNHWLTDAMKKCLTIDWKKYI